MVDGWQDVGAIRQEDASALAWLSAQGLEKHAEKVLEVTGAEHVHDFKLLDAAMVEDVIKDAVLKPVPAQKLRLAIAKLQSEAPGCNESPAPAEPVAVQIPVQLQECIAICIDRSASMGSPLAEVTLNIVRGTTRNSVAERTCMEAVKAMFYAFRDRVESLGRGKHELGLIQFDDKIEKLLDLTSQLDRFESIVDDMKERGGTAIYFAIVEAAAMLEERLQAGKVDSSVDLRVLVLTDGQNNSGVPFQEALKAVNRIGAVVDAIIVGDTPDPDLRRIVNATQGECYQIQNLGEGFELLEAEGVVSLLARRGEGNPKPKRDNCEINYSSLAEKNITTVASVQRAIVAPTLASKSVIHISSMKEESATTYSLGTAMARRAMQELRQLVTTPVEGIHVFPAEDTLDFWRVLLEGPASTPFERGIFALSVVLPSNYPFRPPQITFETPVYHCNVSDSGRICLPLLQDAWHPTLTVLKCLEGIRLMLQSPDTDNSLRQWIAELTIAHQKTNGADTRYQEKASECTRRDASLSVADWRQKWAC